MNLRNFFGEVKRRNVYKVGAAYVVVAWLLIQVATQVFPFFDIPNWAVRLVVLLLALGFPIALIVAWAFELTPEGLKRTEDVPRDESIAPSTGRKLLLATLFAASLAVALLAYQLLRPQPRSAPAVQQTETDKSIAVLPFENFSRDPDNAYFAEGIHEEILTRLAKIADLKVISRTSTARYRSSPENLPEIAKQLGVANVLEGSVQKSGDEVRVTVQLIRAATDTHLWAETYDRKLSEIFKVQSDIAQHVATALEAKLTGREREQIATAVTTENGKAYEAYLRGLAVETSGVGFEQARDAFREAVTLDPKFAAAWAALANSESFLYFQNNGTPEQLARARDALQTALRLAPDTSESYAAATSFYYYCLQDFDQALDFADRARRVVPNNAHIILLTALVNRRQGNHDRAIQLLHESGTLDPRNNDVWLNLARSHRGARRFKEALAFYDRALAIAPGEAAIIVEKSGTLVSMGDLERAEQSLKSTSLTPDSGGMRSYIWLQLWRRDFDRAVELSHEILRTVNPESAALRLTRLLVGFIELVRGNQDTGRRLLEEARADLLARKQAGDRTLWIRDELILAAAALGDRETVDKEGAELLQMTGRDLWRFGASQETMARAYALLGDGERALPLTRELLGKTYQQSLTTADLRLNPEWDKIRSDPRFQRLAEQDARP